MDSKQSQFHFVDVEKLILKFVRKGKRVVNTALKKNKVRGRTPPDFKTYYKCAVIMTHITGESIENDQQNSMENTEIDPYKYSQLIFDKGAKTI